MQNAETRGEYLFLNKSASNRVCMFFAGERARIDSADRLAFIVREESREAAEIQSSRDDAIKR